MKIGFTFFGVSARRYGALAAKADEVGFESAWLPEHLVLPTAMTPTYPYSADGMPPINSKTQMYDPWVTLAFAAAATKNIIFGTNVYILPLRNPFVTARAVVTLDMLSNGRIILGCGVGWFEKEFEVVGENFKNRAGRTVEIVEILKKLWTEESIEYHGKYYNFEPVNFEPKPTRKPHPPIMFGGTSPAAIKRMARLGSGFIGLRHTPEELRDLLKKINEARKEAGTDKQPFEVTVSGGSTIDEIRRLEEAGATRVNVVPWSKPEGRMTIEHALAGIEDFGNKVLPRLK